MKNIAIIIVLILMVLDIVTLIKEWKTKTTEKGFIPIWLQKLIPLVVSFVGYGIIIYAIIL